MRVIGTRVEFRRCSLALGKNASDICNGGIDYEGDIKVGKVWEQK